MSCKACGASLNYEMRTEMVLHFPGYKNLDKPQLLIFPDVLICLSCGSAEFSIPEEELSLIQETAIAAMS